jgi:cytochrome P450
MIEYFMSLIEKRRPSPRSDLLSTLIAACASGQQLSEREILGFCVLMLVAGNETSSNLITNTFWSLDENPDVMDRLRAAPEGRRRRD